MFPRSAFTIACVSGRCTLTTTSVPSNSVARWTWASEAAPSGSRSKVANRVSGEAPSSSRMMASTCSYGERRHGTLELVELQAPFLRQLLRAAGDHLPDLHVRRAQPLEHDPDLGGRGQGTELVGVPSQQTVRDPAEARQRRPGQGDVQAVLEDDLLDLGQADVLQESIATGARKAVRQPPKRLADADVLQSRPVEAEQRLDREQEEGQHDRDRGHPEQARIGHHDLHPGDLDGQATWPAGRRSPSRSRPRGRTSGRWPDPSRLRAPVARRCSREPATHPAAAGPREPRR